MKKISLLIPAYNEENTLPKLYDEFVRLFNACGESKQILSPPKKSRLEDRLLCEIDAERTSLQTAEGWDWF